MTVDLFGDWSGGCYHRLPDMLSAQYDGPEPSKIPKFSRKGFGCILGLSPAWKIVSTVTGSVRGLEVAAGGSRPKGDDRPSDLSRISSSVRKLRTDRQHLSQQLDFVPLKSTTRSRARISDEANYRSLSRPSSSPGDHSDSEPSSDEEEVDGHNNATRQELKRLDQQTRDDPTDVRAWLALADIQRQLTSSKVLNELGSTKATPSKAMTLASQAKQSTAQVQLAVLEKATKAHRRNGSAVPLQLARIQVATSAGLWSTDEIEQHWVELLASRKDSASSTAARETGLLWQRYLEWRCGSPEFSIDGVQKAFAEGFAALEKYDDLQATQDHRLSLQLQLCLLLRRAGYAARAFAILQAQVELTVGDRTGSWEDLLSAFGVFWDSEAPRLGEPGATGWQRYQPDHVQMNQGQPVEKPQNGEDPLDDPLTSWSRTQRDLTSLRERPARLDDLPQYAAGEAAIDPFSIIFLDDIRPLLVCTTDETITRQKVVDNFLIYLGERPVIETCIDSTAFVKAFWPQSFDAIDTQGADAPAFDLIDGVPMQRRSKALLSDPSSSPMNAFSSDIRASFTVLASSQSPREVAVLLLSQLDELLPTSELRVRRLRMVELHDGHKAAVRVARAMLKKCGQDWDLWKAYADLERRHGRSRQARTVFSSCLQSEDLSDPDQAASFWLEYLRLSLETGGRDAALSVLHTAAKHRYEIVDERDAALLLGTTKLRLAYDNTHERQFVDLYLPANTTKPNPPLVIFVHGGAWRTGNTSDHEDLAQNLAARGICVALIEYRLSLKEGNVIENQHPAHVQDFQKAMEFLLVTRPREMGSKIDYDVRQAVVVGHSIGSWLLCSLLLDPSPALPSLPDRRALSEASTRQIRDLVQAWICLDGIYDIDDMLEEYPNGYMGFVEQAFVPMDSWTNKPTPSQFKDVSVTSWPRDSAWRPRIIVAHSKEDELLSTRQSKTAVEYLEKTLAVKVEKDFESLSGTHDGMLHRQDFFDWLISKSRMERPATAERLIAQRFYEQAPRDAPTALCICSMWFSYLCTGLEEALKKLDDFDTKASAERAYALCQARIDLIRHHLAQPKPVHRPAIIRSALIKAVAQFLTEPAFLLHLASHEARFQLEGVLRKTIDDHVLPRDDDRLVSILDELESLPLSPEKGSSTRQQELPWLTAIYIELHLHQGTFNQHAVRALFERALGTESLRLSNVLWRLYLDFEVKLASKALSAMSYSSTSKLSRMQRKAFVRAKQVFYRALSSCPYDREVYLSCFELPFRTAFDHEELRTIAAVMVNEGELRVYGNVEDLLIADEEGDAEAAGDDER